MGGGGGDELAVGSSDRFEPGVAAQPPKRFIAQLDTGREFGPPRFGVEEHRHAGQIGVTVSSQVPGREFGEGVGAALADGGVLVRFGIRFEAFGDTHDGGQDPFAVIAG